MIRTTTLALLMALVMIIPAVNSSAADPIEGTWKSISDQGKNKGKETSHIKIYEKDGVFYAQITKLLLDPPDTKCTKCKGDKKDKPVTGMVIAWGLKKKGDKKYEKGKILDPDNGQVYGCEMELLSDTKLKVRGYLGFSLFGRNQFWYRVK